MPKTAIDYSKTIIYKIVCKNLDITDTYIGHTTNLIKRRCGHKTTINNIKDKNYNLKVYQYIRENGGWDNFDMIQIEQYSCKNVNEARAKEREYIEFLKPTLNKDIPNRTNKEYRKDNEEHLKKKKKEYREKKKKKIAEKKKEYKKIKKKKIKKKNKN